MFSSVCKIVAEFFVCVPSCSVIAPHSERRKRRDVDGAL